MTVLVALAGPAGSGKSTAASYLVERYGAVRYSFATPLKEIVRCAFELEDHQVYGTQEEKEMIDPRYNVSPRWLMRRIGTEGARAVLGESFWTEITIEKILCEAPPFAVIDDLRFLDESQAVRDAGGRIWMLRLPADEDPPKETHRSESELAEVLMHRSMRPAHRGVKRLQRMIDEALRDSSATKAVAGLGEIRRRAESWMQETLNYCLAGKPLSAAMERGGKTATVIPHDEIYSMNGVAYTNELTASDAVIRFFGKK